MTTPFTPSTLTDRFVTEALRGLPARQRADIEAELRTLIADAIEDRLEAGTDAVAAEHTVLAELGAPRRLAARYSEKPTYLVGPDLYFDYVRVLTVLLSTVVPIWFLFSGIVTFVAGSSAGETVGVAVTGAIETAMSIAFFTTVIFAIIERTSAMRSRRTVVWDPASLPEVLDKRGYFTELVGGISFLVIIASVLIWLQTVGAVEGRDSALIGPIATELWTSGAFYIALFYAAVSISFHLFAYYTGWSVSNAMATIVLDVLFVVPAVWLTASGRLLNPDYFDVVGWPQGVGVVTAIVVVVVLLFSALDSIDAIVRATRKRRTR